MMKPSFWLSGIRWFAGKTRDVLLHPIVFFRGLPDRPGYAEPLLFLLIAWLINLGFSSLLDAVGLLTQLPYATGLNKTEEIVLDFLSLPLAMLLLYVLSHLLGGKGSWQKTVALVAYSSAYLVFPQISFLGYVFDFYGLFLLYTGNKEVFGLSVRRAVFAFLLFALALVAFTSLLGYFLHPILKTF